MALAYALVYVWLDVDAVVVGSRATVSEAAIATQLGTAAHAAAALVMAAARVMPLDTPPVCYSMLLDVVLRLMDHPLWTKPRIKIIPTPAISHFLQSPDLLGVILLLLIPAAASYAQEASTSGSQVAPNSTRTAQPGRPQHAQQQGCELQQQLESLWQQLGVKLELLPVFMAALQSKQHQPQHMLCYKGHIMGYPLQFELLGSMGGCVVAAGLLVRLLNTSPALRVLGVADTPICQLHGYELSSKVSAAGKQQQLLLATVALRLLVVFLTIAAFDPSDDILQYTAMTATELLLCCWQQLGSLYAAELMSGASISIAGSNSIGILPAAAAAAWPAAAERRMLAGSAPVETVAQAET
jgi:hypothetical protein